MKILDSINGHQDLIQLDNSQRQQLCQEIREFLVENISKTGGHLASNLGVVELTVAIETVSGAVRYKAVVWNSKSAMKPIMKPIEGNLN